MKITRVDMYSAEDELLAVFNISEVGNKSPFSVKAMIGLDSAEITPRFYGESIDRSAAFYDAVLPPRSIVVRMGFRQDLASSLTHSDLRDLLYKAINRTRTGLVDLRFMNLENVACRIMGRIVKMEVPHFSKVAEAQLTVECQDPVFRSFDRVHPTVFDDSIVLPTLWRVFSVMDDESNAPHGMELILRATTPMDMLRLTDQNNTWEFVVGAQMDATVNGIVINSEAGSRMAAKVALGTPGAQMVPIADMIGLRSIWPTVFPGQNDYLVEAFQGGNRVSPPEIHSISWYSRFWGI